MHLISHKKPVIKRKCRFYEHKMFIALIITGCYHQKLHIARTSPIEVINMAVSKDL